ncbi:ATPase, P-type (transporting), HAD superfamily, subfamily IC [Methanocorpusculum labreanum Z]|uniref:ATPase, P-type (Transporting), HAD superfamily, subfamily IC n=1 Tax=Methanocorpusculum labreanum (strain ATCC 43576 / DSM 4855 / Z) TaxID=410358 RepID=A2SRE1_METLZ|nr:cation-transporting P-type ATPase [Methanocorpusculum labreanum]ABN06897.1 ATPase, P-type (transporting), HAD superfamily, subfamily IC [Methanocorpusculum labreanum Z]
MYKKTIEDVLTELNTDRVFGLSEETAQKRQQEYGKNELKKARGVSAWRILLHNINNIIVYILIVAAVLSFSMGEIIEGIAVLIALMIAVLTSFFTEYKAQKSIESLQRMIFTHAKVVRGGVWQEINASKLVPGDLIFIEEGDSVPADARLIRSMNFACIESALTGESDAVEKDALALFSEDTGLGDRINMVFAGTSATRGNAHAVVTSTGMSTEVGKITGMLESGIKERTPLGKEMNKLSKILILVALLAGIAVLTAGFVTNHPIEAILHTALILAVAAIPEAMPAVSTMTLSRGMRTMAEHKALVKHLPAVETLGSTNVICTDKTGTLTENQMTVGRIVLTNDRSYTVEGNGYQPVGNILADERAVDLSDDDRLWDIIAAAVLCSNAVLKKDELEYSVIGDPTEGALVVLGAKAGISRESLHAGGWVRIGEMPFDSARKYMITVYEHGETVHAFIKGAPDVLLAMSLQSREEKERLQDANDHLTEKGLRVLGVGKLNGYSGDGSRVSIVSYLDRVDLFGIVGITDPPRNDVREAIGICQQAGIQVKMITGDDPKTASIIAREIGLREAKAAITGKELDLAAGTPEFGDLVKKTAVFARVSPENKMQIVDALRKEGSVVAMTGDGVNDAPALKSADIGVAMGIRGTEVAKEASDMILTDDRFYTIVDAVREGRVIFSNIKKYVSFLFSCNMVEIITIFLSVSFLKPLPILPLHILFLNLVIDIAPAMALAYEPAEANIMKAPPRSTHSGLINKRFLGRILFSGAVLGLSSFLIFNFFLTQNTSLLYVQTATFTFMVLAQLLHVLNIRKENGFGLTTLIRENKVLVGAVSLSLLLQIMVIYVPFMQQTIGTTPLTADTWAVILLAAFATTGVVYAIKKVMRRIYPSE